MTTPLRRAYFHDINSPVQVDIESAKAVAPENIFIGSGLGGSEATDGGGGFGESNFGTSALSPSVFAGAGGSPFG